MFKRIIVTGGTGFIGIKLCQELAASGYELFILAYKAFFKILGKVMNRPSWFHVPGFLLKILLGEMAEGLILSGQRAIPKRLLEAGFKFRYPELESALREILK